MNIIPRRKRFRFAILAAIIAVIFWYSATLQNLFFESTEFLEGLIGERHVVGQAIFVGLATLSAMLSPFSSVPIVPSAVAIWGVKATFWLLLSGWMLGGLVAYLIGRYASSLLKNLKVFRKIEAYRRTIPKTREFFIIMLFRVILPAEIPSYTLGIMKYPLWKYLLITFISEVPFALVAVYASDALVQLEPFKFVGFLLLGVIMFGFIVWIFKTRNGSSVKVKPI